MRCKGSAFLLASIVLAVVLALSVGAASARGDHGPQNNLQKAIQLTSPAVVLIQLRQGARVILNDARTGEQADRNFRAINAGTGSGFVVEPSGTIVTASHVVEPDRVLMRTYFANRLLLPKYGFGSLNPFRQWDGYFRSTGRPALGGLMRRCYRGAACQFRFGGRAVYRVWTGFAIARRQIADFVPAELLKSTGFARTDVAVLKVTAQNMPTVQLAPRGHQPVKGERLEAIGFPETAINFRSTGVTQPEQRGGDVVGTSVGGTSEQLAIDADVEKGMSGGPAVDGSGQVVGLASFAWLQSSGVDGPVYFRTSDSIHDVLDDVGSSPSRGTIDERFKLGMERYWRHEYTDAIAPLGSVQRLQDGHIAATAALADSERRAGSTGDISPSLKDEGGFPWWGIVLIVLGGVVLLGGLLFALMRSGRFGRRERPAAAPISDAPMPERGRTVISTRPSKGEPTLVIREGPGAGQRFAIKQDTLVGREDADIVLDDVEVSRRHALIKSVNGGYEISDLRSANGTMVNGSPVEGVQYLTDGDVIELGKTKLGVELPSDRGGTATGHRREES